MPLRFLRSLLGPHRTSPRVEVTPDHVWPSVEAKFAGIRKELVERTGGGTRMVALVAHFPDVLAELHRVGSEYGGPASVRAVLSSQLSQPAAGTLPLRESDVFDLIVAERHPLASMDDALLSFAETLPCRCRIVYHVSLEDPVLRAFGAESIQGILERLGAAEDEAITHSLITRSIRRAQQRIEAGSTGRADAGSASEWLERNT